MEEIENSGFCPGLGWAAVDEQKCKAEITEHKSTISGVILSINYPRSTPAPAESEISILL